MSRPDTYTFSRYLEAKRTVDERSLNRRVQTRLQDEISEISPQLRVLEIGAGIGVTIERILTWDCLPDRVQYTAVDIDQELVSLARSRLLEQSENSPLEVYERNDSLVAELEDRKVIIDLVAEDAFEYLDGTDRTWDLLIAQAFLDLTGVQPALDTFYECVTKGGLLYFPITFDGGTILEPTVDAKFDDLIERRYHHHMNLGDETGQSGGDSRAGRHLLSAFPALGGEIVAVGGSDWVVTPGPSEYIADERYFMHHLIEMVRGALANDPTIDSDRFDNWIRTRHQQIENNRLSYIAHQLDLLGSRP